MLRIGARVILAVPLVVAGCTAGLPAPRATTGPAEAATLVPSATASPMPVGTPSPADSATPTAGPTETDDEASLSDVGIGETLLIVVGAAHDSQAEAEAAALPFGDMQGFFVDVSDNYRLLEVCSDSGEGPALEAGQLVAGQWLELSAFRTWEGAADFMDVVEMSEGYGFGEAYAGAAIYLVEKTGGPYVGLGAESDPRGGGPLLGPLPEPPECE